MKHILIFAIIGLHLRASSQCITFAYDAAGDRTARNICPQAIRSFIEPIANNNYQVTHSQLADHYINIFPNPTNDLIEVRSDYLSSNSQIFITDILGRKFYSGTLKDGKIDISSLVAGRYYLRISDGNIVRIVSVIKQ
ncbi:MAG TPA: T9SS type A sorting domain-containing protein [Saprospiraceae bacterium]|nr:T9SS type A sorting domain-containing protein [Saprospiraceae bacterium]HNT19172.1 T9SS type A sorting domain-containing protein [Saprospiraceae bacterium]